MDPARARPSTPTASALWLGALLWLAVAVAAVLLHGPPWDESHEHAQVLLGDAVYPEGHPFKRYVFSAFTIQHYFTAALMLITRDPAWICGIRAALSLALLVIPGFLMAAAASGRAAYGHAFALFAISGALAPMGDVYPLDIWWTTYSNGQIGMGFALMTLAMASMGRWRTAALLAGLGPMVHLGQWPPVLGVMLVAVVVAWGLGKRRTVQQAAPWFAGGLAISLAFALIQRAFALPAPVESPYAITADADTIHDIWRGFVVFVDGHRELPGALSLMGSAIAIILGGLVVARRWHGAETLPPIFWPWVYATGTWLVAAAIAVVQASMGHDTPYALVVWMPFRLLNHLHVITLVCVAAALAHLPRRHAADALALGIACLGTLPLMRALLSFPIAERYLTGGEGLLFALVGLGIGALMLGGPSHRRYALLSIAVIIAIAFLPVYRFGSLCLLAALPVPWACQRWERIARPAAQLALPLAACLVAVSFAMDWRDGAFRGPRMHTAWHASLANDFANLPHDDRLVLGRPVGPIMQPRLDRPFFAGHVTPSYISYRADLGPAIDAMYRDAYGVSISYPDWANEPPEMQARSFLSRLHLKWSAHWEGMSAADWQSLGDKYGIGYVIVPHDLGIPPLPLELVSGDPHAVPYALYTIPRGEESAS